MVNAFLRECNFSRHNFYFVGTMRNVSFQIIVRHKMHFPKIPVNKCMFRSAFFIKHSRLYVWYLTSITHQPKWSDLKLIPSKSLQALKCISYEIGSTSVHYTTWIQLPWTPACTSEIGGEGGGA